MVTNPDPVIDLMELADLGQPRKLAFEIHSQLRKQYGKVPLAVPLEGIAKAVGIEDIVDHSTEAFEGTLVVNGARGIVALRRGMRPGRRRFTLGHELGHFLNPWHRSASNRFECSSRDTRMDRATGGSFADRPAQERMEIEANEFSNALLIPVAEYREQRQALGADPDLRHVQQLAETFQVSLEVMSQTYVNTAKEMVGIITSQHGRVKRSMLPKTFPYLGMTSGAPLPADSITASLAKSCAAGTVSDLADVLSTGWLERKGKIAGLCEQVLVQRDGWAVTLLWAEEEEIDEDADDRNWNRRSTRRWS